MRGIDGVGVHDGADAVVEEQAVGAGEARDLARPARRWSAVRWR